MLMNHPTLSPGMKRTQVRGLKRTLAQYYAKTRNFGLAVVLRGLVYSTYYDRGPTLRAVKIFQRRHGLTTDGIVGPKTWEALQKVNNPNLGKVLHGIPWEPSLLELDGRWVQSRQRNILLALRTKNRWHGFVTSAYRPDWYQKLLFDAAVRKYGSYAAASKWVAPPGRSNHRFKDIRGAVDVTRADEVLRGTDQFYRPMSWESWHLQIRSAYGRLRGAVSSVVPVRSSKLQVPDEMDMDAIIAAIDADLAEIDKRIEESDAA